MSNLDLAPEVNRCGGPSTVSARPTMDVHAGKEVLLGEGTVVRRLLPTLGRRLIGAWCFADHYGPDDIAASAGMQVPPHPHIGLQTVSWLLDGAVEHRDSLGNHATIRPGELGLMTAGAAIAHAEQSPVEHPALLHGLQLWVALPDAVRSGPPAWQHHVELPVVAEPGWSATLIMGSLAGEESPGRAHTPLVGADLTLEPGGTAVLPLEPDFEHGVLVMSGSVEIDGATLAPGAMAYLGCARRELRVTSSTGARALLLGGTPFGEQIVMWWNFVARDNDEITQAREQWTSGSTFGEVGGYDGFRLAAPPLPPGRLRPR